MAVPKPMLIEFGIHYRLESCVSFYICCRHKCGDCNEGTIYKSCLHYFEHRQNKHGTPYPSGVDVFYCHASQECKFKSLIRASVKQHMVIVHAKGNKSSVCPICGKTYPTRFQVEHHVKRTHQKVKRHKCPHCPMMFWAMQQCKRHVEVVHTKSLEERKNIMCPQCDQKFASTEHLKTHIKNKHLGLKEYRCTLCDLKFANGCNLREHIGLKHLGIENAKEWRKPENKTIREETYNHPAYEHIPYKLKLEIQPL